MARFFKRTPSPKEGAQTAEKTESAPVRKPVEIQPDPDRIGIAGSVPFVRLPQPATLFADRANRLRALAPGHPLEGYLDFLGRIAQAQASVTAERAARAETPRPLPADDTAMRLANGMPPLARNLLSDDPAFLADLDRLLAVVDLTGAPEAARLARDTLRAALPEDRLDLAMQVFEGAFPVERMAECVFVAAGLQVTLAAHAATLDRTSLKPVADGVCPACGGAPTASLIVAWTPADKARYLSCSLCGTLWNHVRIRCTACGSGEGVSYYGLDEVSRELSDEVDAGSSQEGASKHDPGAESDRRTIGFRSKNVQVETCTTCNSYLKHLHQHRDPMLDPVADDVASYGLDLKIIEEGFRKAGLNPLFVT